MPETMIVRYETLCGCSKEEPFEIKDHVPEFIDRVLFEHVRLADYMRDPTLKNLVVQMKRRRFVFDEILRHGTNLVFVYRELQNG